MRAKDRQLPARSDNEDQGCCLVQRQRASRPQPLRVDVSDVEIGDLTRTSCAASHHRIEIRLRPARQDIHCVSVDGNSMTCRWKWDRKAASCSEGLVCCTELPNPQARSALDKLSITSTRVSTVRYQSATHRLWTLPNKQWQHLRRAVARSNAPVICSLDMVPPSSNSPSAANLLRDIIEHTQWSDQRVQQIRLSSDLTPS